MKRQELIIALLLVVALIGSGCAVGITPRSAPATPTAPAISPAAPIATAPTTAAEPAPAGASPTPSAAAPVAAAAVVATPDVVSPAGAAPATSSPASPAAIVPPSAAGGTIKAAEAPAAVLLAMEAAFESIYARMNPSVVLINVTATGGSGNPFFNQTQQSLGSGFVWDKSGHIVTNNHVIEGADSIIVTFYDGATATAKVVGADPDADLAVISVQAPADKLQPVTLADSTKVKVGQFAIAIGNPFGEQNTMTTGVISALGRSLPVGGGSSSGPTYTIPDVIQTDAPINPGNSGGVLLDIAGEVIGVTSAIESPVQASSGIGFAIPAVIVQRVVPALIKTGSFDHPWLGLSGASLTSDLATAMNLPAGQRGAIVATVVAGGPAAKAGLRGNTGTVTIQGVQRQAGGDVVVAIEGQPVKTIDDLIVHLARYAAVGQTITLTVLRDAKQQDLKVTLQARPDAAQGSLASSEGAYLGVSGITVTAEVARAMSLPSNTQGVLIQQVEPDSPADNAGLVAGTTKATISGKSVLVGGDIIVSFGGQPVSGVDDLNSLLLRSLPGQRVSLVVIRDGRQGRLRVVLDQSPSSDLVPTRYTP